MKKLTLTLLSFFMISMAHAEGNTAIYVWVDGSSTCYKLESMPKVTYKEGSAVLTLKGETEPELTLLLADGKKLKITYGEYQETATCVNSIDKTLSKVTQNGKYISGGKLIIVKNGIKYDSKGIEVK